MKLRRRNPWRKAGLGLSTAAILLFIAEVGLRLFFSQAAPDSPYRIFARDPLVRGPSLYQPHPYLAFALNPTHPEVNSLGFRGPEVPPNSRGRRLRIAALGGSTTYSSSVSEPQSYPRQLEQMLRAKTGREEIDVINAGVADYTTFESFVNLAFRVLDLKPKIVLIYHAGNDLRAAMIKNHRPDNSTYRCAWRNETALGDLLVKHSALGRWIGVRLAGYRPRNLDEYISLQLPIIGIQANWLYERPPLVYFVRNLRYMIRLSLDEGVTPVLCTFPYFSENESSLPEGEGELLQMNKAIRFIAAEENVLLIDLARELPNDPKLFDDDMHATAAGAAAKAEIIAQRLLLTPCLLEWSASNAQREPAPDSEKRPDRTVAEIDVSTF